MFKLDQVTATFIITTCLMFVITLLNVHTCECKHIYSVKGKSAQLNFPFPCDSTEVTLQQSVDPPFFRFADGFVLSMPQSESNRFKVQISVENGNCSLDLTISNLRYIDEGIYLSTIYMDGQLLDELTTRIWLRVDYPPDKASCVEVQDKGGDWVSIDCTAIIGNLAGKIECYQNGQKVTPLSHPVENDSSVTESFLIRKSQPAFCCSSTLNEYTDRCECNDDALNLADGDSNDPCPPSSIITTRPLISIVTENNQADSIGVSYTPINMKEYNKCNECVIIQSVHFSIEVVLFLLGVCVWYRKRAKTTRNHQVMIGMHVHGDGESKDGVDPFLPQCMGISASNCECESTTLPGSGVLVESNKSEKEITVKKEY
ncbi:uncharacterized protein LOC115919905 [Strongylocentrotus purpuratus]|uniref:Uncharacterized protein n=1 Tax=Strongylocentrotus purpuratus TaxID=7668 RepID=A0A7M7N2V3_STRPU|nr:uncharacterized protein LOC115919905 [Strongylocentrotus purpuratus]